MNNELQIADIVSALMFSLSQLRECWDDNFLNIVSKIHSLVVDVFKKEGLEKFVTYFEDPSKMYRTKLQLLWILYDDKKILKDFKELIGILKNLDNGNEKIKQALELYKSEELDKSENKEDDEQKRIEIKQRKGDQLSELYKIRSNRLSELRDVIDKFDKDTDELINQVPTLINTVEKSCKERVKKKVETLDFTGFNREDEEKKLNKAIKDIYQEEYSEFLLKMRNLGDKILRLEYNFYKNLVKILDILNEIAYKFKLEAPNIYFFKLQRRRDEDILLNNLKDTRYLAVGVSSIALVLGYTQTALAETATETTKETATHGAGHAAGHGAGHAVGHGAGHAVGHAVGHGAGHVVGHGAGHVLAHGAGHSLGHGAGHVLAHGAGHAIAHGASAGTAHFIGSFIPGLNIAIAAFSVVKLLNFFFNDSDIKKEIIDKVNNLLENNLKELRKKKMQEFKEVKEQHLKSKKYDFEIASKPTLDEINKKIKEIEDFLF